MRASMPLIVRGGLNRTFGSLAAFAALALLALGVYLLTDAFAHPVDAEAAGVLVAAIALAVAMLLFVFVFKLRRLPQMLRRKKTAPLAKPRAIGSAIVTVTARLDRLRSDLPYQRNFVDRSSIPPRTPSPVQARGIAGK